MLVSDYLMAGYGCIFVETTEIKRCINSLKAEISNTFFAVDCWNQIDGLIEGTTNGKEDADQISILEHAGNSQNQVILLENYDIFLESPAIIQAILNVYESLKSKRVCLIIVGTDIKKIPVQLKELMPILDFKLPDKKEIQILATNLSENTKEDIQEEGIVLDEYDLSVTDDVVDACSGMSYEEIENVLALSIVQHKQFNLKTILDRKRQVIRSTGFMDFMNPEPIESLGGLDNLKDYIYKRQKAFDKESGNRLPKLRSLLLCGIAGCGKSLATKCIASIFDWPAITLDVGGLKGGIVGETEKNTRRACQTIDSIGRVVTLLDEIEKSFAGGGGEVLDSGVSAGMLGYFLTWMQERKSEGILVATANDLSKLPPEFLRAGRWDAIFYVGFPNRKEIKCIIDIMNNRYGSELPNDNNFCRTLEEQEWTGAEIEQLAKDSMFDSLEDSVNNISRISKTQKTKIDKIKAKAAEFRNASVVLKDIPPTEPVKGNRSRVRTLRSK